MSQLDVSEGFLYWDKGVCRQQEGPLQANDLHLGRYNIEVLSVILPSNPSNSEDLEVSVSFRWTRAERRTARALFPLESMTLGMGQPRGLVAV